MILLAVLVLATKDRPLNELPLLRGSGLTMDVIADGAVVIEPLQSASDPPAF